MNTAPLWAPSAPDESHAGRKRNIKIPGFALHLGDWAAGNHSESIEDHPAGIAKFPLPVTQAAQPCESGMDGTVELPIDRAIQDTCSVVYPLHGLDQGTEPERDRPQPPHSGAGRATASGTAEHEFGY